MDLEFMKTHAHLYVEAGKLTFNIAAISIILSLVVGIITALLRHYEIPILGKLSQVYVELSRNTPLLIQLFFLYFGLPKIGILLSSEVCGIIGLTFLGGSYMSESFRSGIESIEYSQIESGLSIGLKNSQVLYYIILPQAITVSFPAILANVIFLIKETSIFSIIALADLMYVARDLIGLYYNTDEALLMLVIAYAVILIPILVIFHLAERKLRYAGFGN